jgi:hypothetical protein
MRCSDTCRSTASMCSRSSTATPLLPKLRSRPAARTCSSTRASQSRESHICFDVLRSSCASSISFGTPGQWHRVEAGAGREDGPVLGAHAQGCAPPWRSRGGGALLAVPIGGLLCRTGSIARPNLRVPGRRARGSAGSRQRRDPPRHRQPDALAAGPPHSADESWRAALEPSKRLAVERCAGQLSRSFGYT